MTFLHAVLQPMGVACLLISDEEVQELGLPISRRCSRFECGVEQTKVKTSCGVIKAHCLYYYCCFPALHAARPIFDTGPECCFSGLLDISMSCAFCTFCMR